MGATTEIAWTDSTWSPLRARVRQDAARVAKENGYESLLPLIKPGAVGPHCERVSEECDHCYSETNNGRCLPSNGTGLPFDRRARDLVEPFIDEKILVQPINWKCGRKIFICSQTDLFGEWITDAEIERVFAVMVLCQRHTFQILTKRPKRMFDFILRNGNRVWRTADAMTAELGRIGRVIMADEWDSKEPWPLPNVWAGISAGNQQRFDERQQWLRATPAAVRWVSAEPLLGPIDLSAALRCNCGVDPNNDHFAPPFAHAVSCPYRSRIHWIVVGGESGSGARPMAKEWATSLRDQCQQTGVPFFFKQWGAWLPPMTDGALLADGSQSLNASDNAVRVGKKKAGRLLDMREWSEFPK